MKIRTLIIYITTGFVVGIIGLIVVQYVTRSNVRELISGNESLLEEYKLSRELIGLQKDLIVLDNSIKTATTSGDSGKLGDFRNGISKIKEDAEIVKKSSASLKYSHDLDLLIGQKISFSQELIDSFYRAGKPAPESFVSRHRALRLTEDITSLTHKIDTTGRIALAQKLKLVDRSGQKVMNWNLYIIVLVLFLLTAVFLIIVNRMRKQAELIRQLNTSEKKLKEAVLVKENFLANMSHEIRTPLNAILGYTDLLQKKKLDDDARLHLETVHQSGETLLAIVNDILDLSKIESGMMRIEQVPFDIRNLTSSVINMFHHKADEKGLILAQEVSAEIPYILIGDATRLTQILANLIGNAVKFTLEGEVKLKISSCPIDEEHLEIAFQISDTGIGIEHEKLETIFERFRQAEDSTTRKFGGTGLGLSIVRDLVYLQNGDIQIRSTAGAGTSVVVTLPYLIDRSPATLATDQKLPTLLFRDKKILIVEDNPINQGLMSHFMQEFGVTHSIAINGKKAIKLLEKERFDLVLMDIQMPEMDGYTATSQIRQKLKLEVPIVAMTANAMPGEREKCISFGMNDHVSKPVREKDLRRIFSTFLKTNLPVGTEKTSENIYGFKVIDLSYMKEISSGDQEYEKLVTAQFLDLLPQQLEELFHAFEEKDRAEIKRIAHNLKTSISIMGLDEALTNELDEIENGDLEDIKLEFLIEKITSVCRGALAEAEIFYQTVNNGTQHHH